MKKIRFFAVPLIFIMLLSGCGTKVNEKLVAEDVASGMKNDISLSEYMVISENEKLVFLFNKDTTAFKILDKSNGYQWLSTGSETQIKSELSAPFSLSFVNGSGLIETMDAMTSSISKGQYKYERTDSGIKVTYSLGEYKTNIIAPFALTKERMKFICDSIDDDFQVNRLESMYQYTEYSNLDDLNKERLIKSYPLLEKTPLYILKETVSKANDRLKELSDLLSSYGYTSKMYKEDSKYFSGVEIAEEEETPRFRVTLQYDFDENGLTVSVPYEEIQMSPSFPMVELELLKFFGAPQSNDIGYFLLPDGSGSIMNFYNGRGDLEEYSVDIYGNDYAAAAMENVYQCDQAYLPVYGVKNGDNAMFSVIEKGDAITTLNAYTGNDQLKAYVAPTFKLRSYYKSFMNGNSNASNYFVSIQNQRFEDDIVVHYAFLNGDDANYSGMAKWYKNYLFDDGKQINTNGTGVIVECVGQIEKNIKATGISYNKEIPLTTFSQVKEIADTLTDSGVDNLSIKLSGWFGGAYRNRYAGKLSVNSKLGSKKELTELSKYLEDKGIGLYPDADMQYTYNTALFDGYSTGSDVATLVSKSKGYKIEYNPATFYRDAAYTTPAYINTPSAIKNAFESFFSKYADLNIKNISLRNVGKNLDGDYNDDNGVDRQKAADMLLDSLKTVDKDYSIMTNGANAYVLNTIDYCCDVPLKSNQRDNTDESVPFLQMVISGKVGYSGSALNLAGNKEDLILDMASVAADAYYMITAQNSDEIRTSDYTFLYCSDFNYLKDDMAALIKEYSNKISSVSGRAITDYIKISNNVYKTIFEGGASVTVNYNTHDVVIDGTAYEAKSYTVDKGVN